MLTTVVFIFLMEEVLTDINVALNKNIRHCSNKHYLELLVDGDRTIENAVKIEIKCHDYFSFEINLGAEYLIHYVVIYEGRTIDRFGTLDNIVIELDNKIRRRICSNYISIKPGTPHINGLRINCYVAKAILVKIRVNNNRDFTMTEVEVYTMGLTAYDMVIYYGCFKSFAVSFLYTNGSTWKNCLSICRNSGTLAAFSNNVENCHCGEINDKSDSISLDQCPSCETHFCGGNGTFSVYIAMFQLPHYMGCYKPIEVVKVHNESTIAGCLYNCSNYTYAALVRGTECECVDSETPLRKYPNTECQIPCTDALNVRCGGPKYSSIYLIKAKAFNLNMLELMRCVGGFDHYGICIGGCEPGYIGAHCIEVQQNYCVDINPCLDILNTECVAINSTYICRCLTGFERRNGSGPCLADSSSSLITMTSAADSSSSLITMTSEVNNTDTVRVEPSDSSIAMTSTVRSEATFETEPTVGSEVNVFCLDFDPCVNISNSNCVKLDSSYECQCNYGFFESSGICEDVDECVFKFCDDKSTCVNMQGHFLCQCKDSFVRLNEFACKIDDAASFYFSWKIPNNYYIYFLLLVGFILCLMTIFIGGKIQKSLSSAESSIPSTE